MNQFFIERVMEEVPPRPWSVEPYGFSLADVKGANGRKVVGGVNYAIAEFIVNSVNERTEP
jgi:hypothetical protein